MPLSNYNTGRPTEGTPCKSRFLLVTKIRTLRRTGTAYPALVNCPKLVLNSSGTTSTLQLVNNLSAFLSLRSIVGAAFSSRSLSTSNRRLVGPRVLRILHRKSVLAPALRTPLLACRLVASTHAPQLTCRYHLFEHSSRWARQGSN